MRWVIRDLKPDWVVLRPGKSASIHKDDPELLKTVYRIARVFNVSDRSGACPTCRAGTSCNTTRNSGFIGRCLRRPGPDDRLTASDECKSLSQDGFKSADNRAGPDRDPEGLAATAGLGQVGPLVVPRR